MNPGSAKIHNWRSKLIKFNLFNKVCWPQPDTRPSLVAGAAIFYQKMMMMESRMDEECLRSIQESTSLAEYFQNIVEDCKVKKITVNANELWELTWHCHLGLLRNYFVKFLALTWKWISLNWFDAMWWLWCIFFLSEF